MGYYIFDQGRKEPGVALEDYATADVDRLVALLENGAAAERQVALRHLIERAAEGSLIRCLASADPVTARLAIHGLWECWLNEQGPAARTSMEEGISAMNDGNLTGAAEIFGDLMTQYPGWAEAINKQATVLYLQGQPENSIALCQRVVALKPDHFGAWSGMAICAIQVEQWNVALEAVRQSLRLQPKSPTNLQLLNLVESRLQLP